jgi:hypothetical protein
LAALGIAEDPETWAEVIEKARALQPHEVPALWRHLLHELVTDPPPIPQGSALSSSQWLGFCETSYRLYYRRALREAGVDFGNEGGLECCTGEGAVPAAGGGLPGPASTAVNISAADLATRLAPYLPTAAALDNLHTALQAELKAMMKKIEGKARGAGEARKRAEEATQLAMAEAVKNATRQAVTSVEERLERVRAEVQTNSGAARAEERQRAEAAKAEERVRVEAAIGQAADKAAEASVGGVKAALEALASKTTPDLNEWMQRIQADNEKTMAAMQVKMEGVGKEIIWEIVAKFEKKLESAASKVMGVGVATLDKELREKWHSLMMENISSFSAGLQEESTKALDDMRQRLEDIAMKDREAANGSAQALQTKLEEAGKAAVEVAVATMAKQTEERGSAVLEELQRKAEAARKEDRDTINTLKGVSLDRDGVIVQHMQAWRKNIDEQIENTERFKEELLNISREGGIVDRIQDVAKTTLENHVIQLGVGVEDRLRQFLPGFEAHITETADKQFRTIAQTAATAASAIDSVRDAALKAIQGAYEAATHPAISSMPAPIEEPQHEEEITAVPPSPPVPSLALSDEVLRVNNLVQSMKDRLIQMNTNNPDSDLSEATRAKPFFVGNKDKYVALLPLQSQSTGSEIFQALNQYGKVIYNNKGLFDSLNRLATSFVTDASPNENTNASTGQLWLWRNSSISFYCHEQLLKNMLDTLRSQVVIFFPHTSAGYQGDITAL